jgi:hypothetical protein
MTEALQIAKHLLPRSAIPVWKESQLTRKTADKAEHKDPGKSRMVANLKI